MSVFGIPGGRDGDAEKPERHEGMTAFDLRDEMAAAMKLMANPAAGAMALTALGFGIAGHAFGLWAGAVVGVARASQQAFRPVEAEQPTAAPVPATKRGKPALKVVSRAEPVEPAPSPEPVALKAPAEPVTPPTVAASEAVEKTPAAPKPTKPVATKARAQSAARSAKAPEPVSAVEPAIVEPALLPEDFHKPAAVERPSEPDDLKAISGIGPKLEKVLNDLGVWTYAQIAAWEPREVAWVDDYLSFTGRIGRDGWIEQARSLAAGSNKKG